MAELAVFNRFDFFLEESTEHFPFACDPVNAKELAPFLEKSTSGRSFAQYNEAIDRTPSLTISYLVDLNAKLAADLSVRRSFPTTWKSPAWWSPPRVTKPCTEER